MNDYPKNISGLLGAWRADPSIGGNVVAWQTQPARAARMAPFPADLHPALAASLRARGIQQLYSHQAQAWERVKKGKNIVVVTGTASGKTLCYNLPVVDRHAPRSPGPGALPLPDQGPGPGPAGRAWPADRLAPVDGRGEMRLPCGWRFTMAIPPSTSAPPSGPRRGSLISNPDMLHTGVLPHHTLWAEFFRNLQFVVIDEIHIYRGVFGSHVANVIRRLQPDRPVLRRQPPVHPDLGDDCQPARAGRTADRGPAGSHR